MDIYTFGKTIGITLMIIAFTILVYFLLTDQPLLELWEVSTMFWFGSSIFWQTSYYRRLTYPENQRPH